MTPVSGTNLIDALAALDDPRRPSNGTLHDFQEILVIAICAMLSDADNFEDIALWGRLKEDWLRRFLTLKNGMPSHDTFERVFRFLDPERFEAVFRQWVGGIVTALGGQMAIDGKTLRGSSDGDRPPAHMVSAFATDLGLVLGQEKVADKSNEITAIPVLLDALYVKGFLVSIDAMGCQRDIAAKIIEKGGDYLLAVKGNQPTLLARIETAFIDCQDECSPYEHVEKSHGRVVAQISHVLPAAGHVDTSLWPQCKMIGRVASFRVVGGKPSELEQRFYISSRDITAEAMAMAVRAHWGIENQLHWMLDVNFGEDGCQVRKDNAPQNLSLLKKIVLNLIRADTTDNVKTSLRQKRKRAAWDDNIRMRMLGLPLS
jgi:predicted transposase YbfD/YdcC